MPIEPGYNDYYDANTPVDDEGEERSVQEQVSKEEARYRRGDSLEHCGLCEYYIGRACEQVEGEIDPHDVCDLYEEYQPDTEEEGPSESEYDERGPPDKQLLLGGKPRY